MCMTFSFTQYPRDIYVILGHDNSTLVVGRCITCNKMNATVVPALAAQIIYCTAPSRNEAMADFNVCINNLHNFAKKA